MSDEPKTYKQPVSSVTGRVVSWEHAKAHPDITYVRTVHVKREVVELPEPEEVKADE